MDAVSRQRIVLLLGYLAEDTIQNTAERMYITQYSLIEIYKVFHRMLYHIIDSKIKGSQEHKTLAKYFFDSMQRRMETRFGKIDSNWYL
ncbi:hypothetical protein CROQUDRAFT_530234 [Cronartium quercuum f. sp. fusiforme G11]|uniref:Uncharacterized protein n=1 Tax=Cronartium quercuum f. sp. fusiforme G11 TaxID=708437 RepID=A0A9P6NL73_9BASI|nr:hypothetical protein CROQUDRAFT_530234 [Cronartium quercuum f. sp. fusiforme G11]